MADKRRGSKKVASVADFCDVCLKHDGSQNMKLFKCTDCSVAVHYECYYCCREAPYLADTPDRTVFRCWACRAVGRSIQVRQIDKTTKEPKRFLVEERPRECCFCCVEDDPAVFPHAMHAVFDKGGLGGRQMVLPATKKKPERLAWAHTLCCLTISHNSNTAGCVYGIRMDGSFSSDDPDHDDGYDSPYEDLALCTADDEEYIHHFAYSSRLGIRAPKTKWEKAIAAHQKLKCGICGRADDSGRVIRIPLQCSAGDEHEPSKNRSLHCGLVMRNDVQYAVMDTCFQAMHVGCAMWHKDVTGQRPQHTHVIYDPKPDKDGALDPLALIYCQAHVEDLIKRRLYDPEPPFPRRGVVRTTPRRLPAAPLVSTPRPADASPAMAAAPVPAAKDTAAAPSTGLGPRKKHRAPAETKPPTPREEQDSIGQKMAVQVLNAAEKYKLDRNKVRQIVVECKEVWRQKMPDWDRYNFDRVWRRALKNVSQALDVPYQLEPANQARRRTSNQQSRPQLKPAPSLDNVKPQYTSKKASASADGLTESGDAFEQVARAASADEVDVSHEKAMDADLVEQAATAAFADDDTQEEGFFPATKAVDNGVSEGQTEPEDRKMAAAASTADDDLQNTSEGVDHDGLEGRAVKRNRVYITSESKEPSGETVETWFEEAYDSIMQIARLGKISMESILKEQEPQWKEKLQLPPATFKVFWDHLSSIALRDRWCFLYVGKYYNHEGLDVASWDEVKETTLDEILKKK